MRWLAFIVLMIVTLPAFATSQKAVPKLKVENDQSGPISNKAATDIYDNCLFHIPDRFTPDARKYYCTCNAASIQGNLLTDEYRDLQKPSNRKPGNKTFEKYIHTAVMPCLLDLPVKQIEYLSCLLASSDDVRIGYAPGYCNCVTGKMLSHAKALGEADMMTKLVEDPGAFQDPVDALWNSPDYLNAKYKSRDDCIIEGH